MSKALITPSIGSEIKGGVETFSEYLRRVFPDLVVIDYKSASSNNSLRSKISLPYLEDQRWGVVIAKEFLRLHRENPFELVICNGPYGWSLTGINLDIPMINIFHGTWVGVNQSLFPDTEEIFSAELSIKIGGLYGRGIFEKISGLRKHCIAVSPLVKDELKRYYGFESEVILNCIDTDFFRPMDKEECRERLNLPKNKKIGFFPSGTGFGKGFDIILELVKIHKDIIFILVGGKEGENVIGISRIPFRDMPIYYNASDFVIVPSRYEGFGLAPLEVLACNIPVITSKSGIFYDDQYNDLAKVVPTSNWKDYSQAIEEIIDR